MRQRLGIDLGRTRYIAFGEYRFGLFDDFGNIGLACRRHAAGQLLDESVHLAFRNRAHEAVGRLATNKGDHRRDRLDSHLAGNGGMLVDVHLDQLDLAPGGADRLFKGRRELAARPAPGCPEVDQDRLTPGFLDHVLHEGLGRGLLDQIGHGLSCRSAALLYYRHGVLVRCLERALLARPRWWFLKFCSARWRSAAKFQLATEGLGNRWPEEMPATPHLVCRMAQHEPSGPKGKENFSLA